MGTPHRHLPHKIQAHPAHPSPPAHFQQPVATAPTKQFDDPRWCVVDLMSKISTATTQWQRFAHALGGAYSWAWHTQGTVLKQVRENLEARAKQQEAEAMFMLSLLTMGLGGPLAGACVRKVLGTAGEAVSEEFVKDMVDKAKDKAVEFAKSKEEAFTKKLYHPPAEEALSPAGVEPLQYQDAMLEGIEFRSATLQKLNQALITQISIGQPLDNLPEVYKTIVTSPFVANPPGMHIRKEDLQVKALLALWLSWGWGRDVAYWRKHSIPTFHQSEAVDFEPVHNSLIQCGVPESRIGQQFMSFGGNWRDVEKIQTSQGEKDWDKLKMINMSKFIEWCLSDDCIEVLFHGLPIKSQWFWDIKVQVQLRRALGPYARYLNKSE